MSVCIMAWSKNHTLPHAGIRKKWLRAKAADNGKAHGSGTSMPLDGHDGPQAGRCTVHRWHEQQYTAQRFPCRQHGYRYDKRHRMEFVDCVGRMRTVPATVPPRTMEPVNMRQAQRYPNPQELDSAYDNSLRKLDSEGVVEWSQSLRFREKTLLLTV